MIFPTKSIPLTEIPLEKDIQLFLKREDLIHPTISGNKYWKLFFNINSYLKEQPEKPLIITFGGAFSNHIAALGALGREYQLKTIGIIRGEELEKKWKENPTLNLAAESGMSFRFVTRESYRDKDLLIRQLQSEFKDALIIPEGGTNDLAVRGIQYMLTEETKTFDYLCCAVGTGGTIAGISKFAAPGQQVLGFKAVDDSSLFQTVKRFSRRNNFQLLESHDGGYGKINDENIRFINSFSTSFGIQLDPVYTGKMMRMLFEMIENGHFKPGSKILAFHTGGLQGIWGANKVLEKQNRNLIELLSDK